MKALLLKLCAITHIQLAFDTPDFHKLTHNLAVHYTCEEVDALSAQPFLCKLYGKKKRQVYSVKPVTIQHSAELMSGWK